MNKKDLKTYFSKLGKIGGKKRMASLSKKQLSDLGRKAARARWAKRWQLTSPNV